MEKIDEGLDIQDAIRILKQAAEEEEAREEEELPADDEVKAEEEIDIEDEEKPAEDAEELPEEPKDEGLIDKAMSVSPVGQVVDAVKTLVGEDAECKDGKCDECDAPKAEEEKPIAEALSAEDFVEWHDHKYEEPDFEEKLEKVYAILDKYGKEEEDVDVVYDRCSDEDKEAIAKIIDLKKADEAKEEICPECGKPVSECECKHEDEKHEEHEEAEHIDEAKESTYMKLAKEYAGEIAKMDAAKLADVIADYNFAERGPEDEAEKLIAAALDARKAELEAK